jgi:response regulator RpfG family c-di-GMP phosphodiesterase
VNSRPVLVIEDNPPLRRMLATTLRTAGYQVVEVGDGASALASAAERTPALVIQDLMLPDVEPAALLEGLRGLCNGGPLPVIAASGAEEKLAAFKRDGAGFTDYLLKPVEPCQLLQSVGRYLEPLSADDSFGRGRRLILADDDPVQRKLAQLRLEQLGFAVRTADDGAGALAAARESRPDAIVSDVLMPGTDGFQLCRAVREDPMLQRVPVVLVSSAYVEAEDRRLATLAGADAYVERTPGLDEVGRALSSCLLAPLPRIAPAANFEAEHLKRLHAQLDAQLRANFDLRERLAVSAVDLSVVSGISSVLSRATDASAMLDEALARCLEVAELGAAVIYLTGPHGRLSPAAQAGSERELVELRRALGMLDVEARLAASRHVELPSRGSGARIAVGLGQKDRPLGILVLAWRESTLSERRIALARAIAGQLGDAIALQRTVAELDRSRERTIARLALAAESRDRDTARHTERVGAYSALLAERIGLEPRTVELVRLASLMHDVGKIGVSDAILLKPGSLTPWEYEQMKAHTTIGHQILAGSGDELLDLAATIALTHHERIDGKGYPIGMAGEEIPIAGRIVAIADVFDALTSDRVYRAALPTDRALRIMIEGRGRQFDAELLGLFTASLADVLAVLAGRTPASATRRAAVAGA